MTYLEPTSSANAEIEIKKSRFISFAQRVTSRDEATAFIASLRLKFPDARHICWAYLIGDPINSTNAGCNDDGEPSGTAGKPMLAQINYSKIGNVVVASVRYFGGIRLGAGGLVRAYRESAQKVLQALETEQHTPMAKLCLSGPFQQENTLRKLIDAVQGTIIEVCYATDVTLELCLPAHAVQQFLQDITNLSVTVIDQ